MAPRHHAHRPLCLALALALVVLLPALAASFAAPVGSHVSRPFSSRQAAIHHGDALASSRQRQRQQWPPQHPLAATALPLVLHQVRGGASTSAAAPAGDNKKKKGNLLLAYLEELDRRPLLTKSWSSGVICAIGDCLSQYLVRKAGLPFQIDAKRLAIFSTVGALYVGPAVHYWFGFLDALSKKPSVAKRLPNFKLAPVLFQLSLDQTFGASVLNSGFLVSLWIVQALVAGTLFPLGGEAGSVSAISSKLAREFWPMLMANYKLWPLANAVNFSLVPLKLRVLFANVVSVFWNIYLSSASNR